MILFYVLVPVVTMTNGPKPVSQAIFGERVEILQEENDLSLIRTTDNYEGWVPTKTLAKRQELYDTALKVSRIHGAHLYAQADTEYGPLMTLPFEAVLQQLDDSDPRWLKVALPSGQEAFIQRGDVAPEPISDLIAFSKRFLDLPYTWGGRSSFGYDCSGFVQMLYRQIGIHLPRDSKDQIHDKRFTTVPLDDLKPGDLLFFGPNASKTNHVGLYIGDNQFIHANVLNNKPWITISSLSDLEWSGDPAARYPHRTARRPT